jgi:site-specific recombinase XerD
MTAEPTTRPKFDELSILRDEWTESLQAANRRPLTIKSYRLALDQFREFLKSRGMPLDVRALRREHVESFLVDLDAKGNRPATRAQRYRSLQQFFRWAVSRDEIERSPMDRMMAPKVEAPLVPILREDDIRRLLHACDGRSFDDRRDAAMVRLLLDTGARRQEVADIRVEDVDFDRRVVVIRDGKGGRPRLVRFSTRTRSALQRYVNERERHAYADHPALWLGRVGPITGDGVAQIVRRRGDAAGLKDLHPHQFRHSRAHLFLAAGMNETDVQLLMGWRSPQMLRRYGASAATDGALDAFDRLEQGW